MTERQVPGDTVSLRLEQVVQLSTNNDGVRQKGSVNNSRDYVSQHKIGATKLSNLADVKRLEKIRVEGKERGKWETYYKTFYRLHLLTVCSKRVAAQLGVTQATDTSSWIIVSIHSSDAGGHH